MNHPRSFDDTFSSNILGNDCSKYRNDEDIVHNFPFVIQLNPFNSKTEMAYAKMKNKHVYQLNIIQQKHCIPPLIFCLKNLSILEIDNTSFCQSKGQLPRDIARLRRSLTDLSILNTEISHVPDELGQLKHLKRIKFSNIGLTTLPDSIENLSSLEFLLLPQNNLSSFPKTLHNVRSLHYLDVTQNPTLNSFIYLNGHPTLRYLNTRQCSFKHLPQNLPQLDTLDMIENDLTDLHGIDTLGHQSSKMKKFSFLGNQINVLTPSIKFVPNLFQLNLARNHLHVLPEDIFHINSLKELNIAKNVFNPRDLQEIVSHFNQINPKLTIIHDQSQSI